jgi:diguanylate cyclase (GGDEF)-like protein
MVERTSEEAQRSSLLLDHLIVPEDRPIFQTWRNAEPRDGRGETFELRLLTRGGKQAAVEIALIPVRWTRRDYLLGFVRSLEDKRRLEEAFRAEIDEHKKRTVEAIKSSVRIYQITEKIERTLALTKNLLNTENETQLFESAARILTSEGLNYQDVTFLMVSGNHLEVRHSTKPFAQGRFPLADTNKYAAFVRHNFSTAELPKDEVLVPLKSRGNFLGLIEVNLLARERIFFDDLRMVSEWQRNVLNTIGDIIGLHLDNLRLYGELKRQSMIDPLTGAYNRHYFVGRLSAEMNRCARTGRPISMIFIDVDEFKTINDLHGHLQGDQVLRELAALFMKNLREEDCICRYGGDEFVALLPEVDSGDANRIAEKLLTAVREHRFYSLYSPEVTLPISVSMGVSVLEKNQDEDNFLQAADAALYQAKKRGRNRYEVPPRPQPAA